MKKYVFLALALAFIVAGSSYAVDFLSHTSASDNTNILFDIIRQVLDIVVDFIGKILDEVVRAIKDIMNSGAGKK